MIKHNIRQLIQYNNVHYQQLQLVIEDPFH